MTTWKRRSDWERWAWLLPVVGVGVALVGLAAWAVSESATLGEAFEVFAGGVIGLGFVGVIVIAGGQDLLAFIRRGRPPYLYPWVRVFMLVTVVLLMVGGCSSHVGNVWTGVGVADDSDDVVTLPGVNFYAILRLFVCAAMGWWIVRGYMDRDWIVLGIACTVAAVFNPIWRPPFSAEWWHALDALVAAALSFATWALSSGQRNRIEAKFGICSECHGLGETCCRCQGTGSIAR